jgi:hypothetical protein
MLSNEWNEILNNVGGSVFKNPGLGIGNKELLYCTNNLQEHDAEPAKNSKLMC